MSILFQPHAGDPQAPTPFPSRPIGPLWRRIVAALVDAIILVVAGNVMALPFFDTLSRLGAWGPLIGFCVALPYYGLLNSRAGNGQTPGKRLLHLQVVNANGETISVTKSLVRYAVLIAPFLLNEMTLPITRTPKFIFYLMSVIVFGLGSMTIYLVLFNRKTRQGVHDLAVGSYVAEADETGALKVQRIWKGHWVVGGALVVLFVVGGFVLEGSIQKLYDFPMMFADARLIEEMEGVQSVDVNDWTWTSWSGGGKKTIYDVRVSWSGKKAQGEWIATEVASRILQHNTQVMGRNFLRIEIVRGYNLGIARAWVNHRFEDTPANWKMKLRERPTQQPLAPAKL